MIELSSYTNTSRGWWKNKKQTKETDLCFSPVAALVYTESTSEGSKESFTFVSLSSLLSVYPQSLTSASSSLAWVAIHFFFFFQFIWFSLGSSVQLLSNQIGLPNVQQTKMLRRWDLQQRMGLFTRLPREEMVEQVSDAPPRRRGAWDIYGIKKQGGLKHGERLGEIEAIGVLCRCTWITCLFVG